MLRSVIALGSILLFSLVDAGAQVIGFGFGDSTFETSLKEINIGAALDMGGFQAEVVLSWGQPAASVQLVLGRGFQPAEVYLVAAFANLSGRPIMVVVDLYVKNKAKGWGALAKDLGIKPGSKKFKTLKDKAWASSDKLKKKQK